jgi:hypothetical protein
MTIRWMNLLCWKRTIVATAARRTTTTTTTIRTNRSTAKRTRASLKSAISTTWMCSARARSPFCAPPPRSRRSRAPTRSRAARPRSARRSAKTTSSFSTLAASASPPRSPRSPSFATPFSAPSLAAPTQCRARTTTRFSLIATAPTFRNILNFLRCGTMVWPAGARARREVLLEASFYGLDKIMLQASTPLPDDERDAEGEWRSNVIFIGIAEHRSHAQRQRGARARRRAGAVDVGNGVAVDLQSGLDRHFPDHQRRELRLLARGHQPCAGAA